MKTSSELVEEIRRRDNWADQNNQSTMYHFFVDMAINNTVVVSAHPHYDKVLLVQFSARGNTGGRVNGGGVGVKGYY